jgi:hypothetical protein
VGRKLECDIVMEGGVTSGVVYPRFITGLARRYNLRSIGGTSVGAVAAVAAAAAQYRRNAGGAGANAGFVQLAKLPRQLGQTGADGRSMLFTLFQPCAGLRPHFLVLEECLNRHRMATRIGAFACGLLQHFQIGALAAIALLLAWRWAAHTLPSGGLPWLGFAVSLLLAALLGAGVNFGLTAWRGLRRNRLGICSGMRPAGSPAPALTEWLHGLVQNIAGLPDHQPLTFGMLRNSSPPIELAFITTGLSELSCHRLPHASDDLLFRASELQQLFPNVIVDEMVAASMWRRPSSRRTLAMLREADPHFDTPLRDLYFLPQADDLPVLVGARLSLSFPILMQAVPLYRLRFTEGDGVAEGAVGVKPLWMSDGGLTSNFPIHFFDSLLPERPTFGVTLQSTLAERAPSHERIYLPLNNNQGWTPPYVDIRAGGMLPSLPAFIGALLLTIRTWRHEALKRTPGFRDRIVQIRHTAREGGLNLNMPADAIASMSRSGAQAAAMIVKRFDWRNHRQVRMRCAAAVLQPKLNQATHAWQAGGYAAMWRDPELQQSISYGLSASQRSSGEAWWDALAASTTPVDLTQDAPNPRPTLEIAPRQT